MASYNVVNYSLRPAKAIERKMLCELMRRLNNFAPIETYSYIGFGSIFFTDFTLFHRALGITKMCSIEKDAEVAVDASIQNRFEFNKPFSCIELLYGPAGDRLPELSEYWPNKTVVWLDYDGRLSNEYLSDLGIALQRAVAGSLVMISVNVKADERSSKFKGTTKEYRFLQLDKWLNRSYIPLGTQDINLSSDELIKLYYKIIDGVVTDTIMRRNGALPSDQKVTANQVVNFRYQDGAPMLTIGWLITTQEQSDIVTAMDLETLPFIRRGSEYFNVSVPSLTLKEISWLDSVLHTDIDDDGTIHPPKAGVVRFTPELEKPEVKQYKQIYRYFPTFAEAIL
jgi:hypothetical protein